MTTARLGKILAAVLISIGAGVASAQNMSVGVSADVTSIDPHYHLYSPNQNIADHVFGRLIERNDKLRMLPGLALSWAAIDELTWEF